MAAADPFVTTQDCGYIWYNSTGLRTPDMVTDGMHPTLAGTQARPPSRWPHMRQCDALNTLMLLLQTSQQRPPMRAVSDRKLGMQA